MTGSRNLRSLRTEVQSWRAERKGQLRRLMYVRTRGTSIALGALLLTSLLVGACTANTSAPRSSTATALSPSPLSSPTPTPTARPAHSTDSRAARCPQRARDSRYKKFVPDTTQQNRDVVLPVVFPDGSSAELAYPPGLKLAELGIQPAVSVGVERDRGRFLHQRFLMITKTPLEVLRRDGEPLEIYRGPTGRVTVWRPQDRKAVHRIFMHFRVGSWNVIVGDGNVGDFMGRKNRRRWASNLAGHETASGFPVLDPRPPLAFARGSGQPDIYLSTCFRFLELRLERCKDLAGAKLATNQTSEIVRGLTVQRNKTGGTFGANWCTASGALSVYVSDRSESFVDRVVEGLRVRNVIRNPAANYFAP